MKSIDTRSLMARIKVGEEHEAALQDADQMDGPSSGWSCSMSAAIAATRAWIRSC